MIQCQWSELSFGDILEIFWRHLQAFWRHLETFTDILETFSDIWRHFRDILLAGWASYQNFNVENSWFNIYFVSSRSIYTHIGTYKKNTLHRFCVSGIGLGDFYEGCMMCSRCSIWTNIHVTTCFCCLSEDSLNK